MSTKAFLLWLITGLAAWVALIYTAVELSP
jgi:hypothetical protein